MLGKLRGFLMSTVAATAFVRPGVVCLMVRGPVTVASATTEEYRPTYH